MDFCMTQMQRKFIILKDIESKIRVDKQDLNFINRRTTIVDYLHRIASRSSYLVNHLQFQISLNSESKLKVEVQMFFYSKLNPILFHTSKQCDLIEKLYLKNLLEMFAHIKLMIILTEKHTQNISKNALNSNVLIFAFDLFFR